MTRLLVLVALVTAVTGCATTTRSRLRDTDGAPLPAYALDDSRQIFWIYCADGAYQISLDRDSDLYSPVHKVTYRVVQPGSDQTMCNRILAYRR